MSGVRRCLGESGTLPLKAYAWLQTTPLFKPKSFLNLFASNFVV